jgi:hypothetical protein
MASRALARSVSPIEQTAFRNADGPSLGSSGPVQQQLHLRPGNLVARLHECHRLAALEQCHQQQTVMVGVRTGPGVLNPRRLDPKGGAVGVAVSRHAGVAPKESARLLWLQPPVEDRVQERLVQMKAGYLESLEQIGHVQQALLGP